MSRNPSSFDHTFERTYLNEISKLAKIGGWRYIKEGDKTWLSDQVYEIYGVENDSIWKISEGISFYKGESRKKITDSFKKLLEDGTPYDLVLAFQNARKENLWVRAKGIPIYEGDEIIGAWGVLQDITDLFLLQAEHEFIQSFTSELHIVLRDKQIVDLNDGWSRITGYDNDEAIGRDWIDFLHPDEKEQGEALRQQVLDEKSITNLPVRCIHKKGGTIHLSINAKVAPDGETIFAIARDVTKAKQRELELQESLIKETAANQAKNQFLMMMSHELRTPLNPIVAFTDVLAQQTDDKEQLEMLNVINDSAQHLSNLLSEILDISSIETGKMTLQEDQINLLKLIKSSHEMMLPRAKQKGLWMHLKLGQQSDIQMLEMCLGDQKKIRQILLNLINNAINFTESGGISINVLKPVVSDQIVGVQILVKDTGIGIDKENLEKIFDVFHQVEIHKSEENKGMGLGLALCRKLARLMNGDISVDSAPGRGSCFTLNLQLQLQA